MLNRSAITADTMVLTENGWMTARSLYLKHPTAPRVVTAKITKSGNYHRFLEHLTGAAQVQAKTTRLYHARSKRPVVGSDLNPAVYGLSAYKLLPVDMGSELDAALQTGGFKAVTLDKPQTYYSFNTPNNILIVAQKTRPTYKKIVVDFDDDDDEEGEGGTAIVVTDTTFSPDNVSGASEVQGHEEESYILEGQDGVIRNNDTLFDLQPDSDYAMDFLGKLDERASMAGSMAEASLIMDIEDSHPVKDDKELDDERINGQDYLYAHIKCQ